MFPNRSAAHPKCWDNAALLQTLLNIFRKCHNWAIMHLEISECFCTVLQHYLISSSFVQQKPEGAMSSGSTEVGLHCAHNWNPPESQVKMTPWQAARRRAGANSGLSCHEIQYQSQLSGTMVLQISVRLTKGCTSHKTQTTCTHTYPDTTKRKGIF